MIVASAFLCRDFSCAVRRAASIQCFGPAVCNLAESNDGLGSSSSPEAQKVCPRAASLLSSNQLAKE